MKLSRSCLLAIVCVGAAALVATHGHAQPRNPFNVGIAEGGAPGGGVARWIIARQMEFERGLSAAVRAVRDDPWAIRWLADRYWKKHPQRSHLSEEERVAESDKSPGVLLASGYIAGGAIAGIIIAFLAGVPGLDWIDTSLTKWANAHNPFFNGANSDLLSLLPFAVLMIMLYLVAMERWLVSRKD